MITFLALAILFVSTAGIWIEVLEYRDRREERQDQLRRERERMRNDH